MEIQTPRARLEGRDLRRHRPAACRRASRRGWTKLGGGTVRNDDQRFKLDTGGERYRYYLVWITELPPNSQRVEIGELALFERKARSR